MTRRELLRGSIATLGAFAIWPHKAANAQEAKSALIHATEAILARQMEDGALVMGRPQAEANRVVPYFAHLSALGLLAAHKVSPSKRSPLAVSRWLDWYDAHRNPDGTVYDYTGSPNAWKPTHDYDSTDSYAAVYCEVVASLFEAERSREKLEKRYPGVLESVRALELTLQSNGLTLAKPSYPVWYTMDNVEVYRGWRNAEKIARAVGKKEDAEKFASRAAATLHAIETLLWNGEKQDYLIALQPDGGRDKAGAEWYPGQMANLLVIAWLPADPRRKALFARLRQAHPDLPQTVAKEQDLDRLTWWAMAAQTAGDKNLLRDLQNRLNAFDPNTLPLYNTALLGHLCRILAKS